MDVQPAPAVESPTGTATTQQAPAANAVQGAVPASETQATPQQQSGIAPAVAKLFSDAVSQPVELNVSYRVEGHDVVTVFTDPKTGKEVTQFPSEILLGLAQFFDQQSGVTFDKNA